MKNPIAPKSNSSQEKVSKKFPIFFIVVVVLLLVIGGLGYLFGDSIQNLFTDKQSSEDTATVAPEDGSAFGEYITDNIDSTGVNEKERILSLDYDYLAQNYSEEEINSLVPENPEFPYDPEMIDNIGGDLEIKLISLQPIFLDAFNVDNNFFIKVAMRDKDNNPGVFDIFIGSDSGVEELNSIDFADETGGYYGVDIREVSDFLGKGDQMRTTVITNIPEDLKPFESENLYLCKGIEHLCTLIDFSVGKVSLYPAIYLSESLIDI